MGVLQTEHSRDRVHPLRRKTMRPVDLRLDVVWDHDAASGLHAQQADARQCRGTAAFPVGDMRGGVDDRGLAIAGVQPERDLVGHRPGRHENGRFLAEFVRDPPFERDRGGIVVINIVAHFCRGHRRPHRVGRFAACVAAQIDCGIVIHTPACPC
nr:hypothetical protein [Sphingosinicella microcystinivorans]